MKYEITYSCGHAGTVALFGPTRDRDRKLEWYKSSAVCPDCYAKKLAEEKTAQEREREEASASAAEQARLMGLPSLRGSEKQVAWAERLRMEFYEEIMRRKPKPEYVGPLMRFMSDMSWAKDWIDEKSVENLMEKASDYVHGGCKQLHPDGDPNEQAARDGESVLLQPEESRHGGEAVLRYSMDTLLAIYPRDDAFRELVKAFDMSWDANHHAWARKIDTFSGPKDDRLAELGHTLLDAGFRVQFPSKAAADMAASASYQPEQRRWVCAIVKGEMSGMFGVCYEKGNEDLYREIKKIPGSKWYHGEIAVPVSEYEAVLEMAELRNFSVSDGARSLIDDYKAKITITPVAPAPEKPRDLDASIILESSDDVLPDLEDEP